MHDEPHHPRGQTTPMTPKWPLHICYSAITFDRRHVSFVELSKFLPIFTPEILLDHKSCMLAHLDRRLSHTRYLMTVLFHHRQIATNEYLGCPAGFKSLLTRTRLRRSISTFSIAPISEAPTPAAQTMTAASIRSPRLTFT